MTKNPWRVLLLYTDKYFLIKQIYPFGLNRIANHLRRHGHNVTVAYPFLPDEDLGLNLPALLKRHQPEVIGLGLRNLDTCMACEQYGDFQGHGFQTFSFLPHVKKIVKILKKNAPNIPLVIGGSGFSFSPEAILRSLGLKYGIVGEGEEPMRLFIEYLTNEKTLADIPGLAIRRGKKVRVNPRQAYAFNETDEAMPREASFNHAYEKAGLSVQFKRGCNQKCSYCVEPIIEGERFTFRSVERVLMELNAYAHDSKFDNVRNIFFVDTEFNIPNLKNASALVQGILETNLQERFEFSSQFLPKPFNNTFAQLLAKAGFSVILTCDSFSDQVLRENGASYRREHILSTLKLCQKHSIPCTVNLIFGLPGETRETVDATLKHMLQYPPTGLRTYEYTVGARIYQGTPLHKLVQNKEHAPCLYGQESDGCLDPWFYCSPKSPLQLKQYIDQALPFPMEFRNNYSKDAQQALAVAYLADQQEFDEALLRFSDCSLDARLNIYDYFFRKLTSAGHIEPARGMSVQLLKAMERHPNPEAYQEQMGMVWFFLNLLGGPEDRA
ncbi:MAG: radical SAM protein [Thermodesulfobacteriota bacterium]|nr:radical SAM protein [Thermodesulfobacteriota bacterium]